VKIEDQRILYVMCQKTPFWLFKVFQNPLFHEIKLLMTLSRHKQQLFAQMLCVLYHTEPSFLYSSVVFTVSSYDWHLWNMPVSWVKGWVSSL